MASWLVPINPDLGSLPTPPASPPLPLSPKEKVNATVKRIATMALACKHAYTLEECVDRTIMDEKKWNVIAIKRQSGFEIPGKPVLCLQERSGQTGIFAVPGTVTKNDWVSNFHSIQSRLNDNYIFSSEADPACQELMDSEGSFVHAGFLSVAESIIRSLETRFFEDKKDLCFTGHSQGGAVASILALYAATHRIKLGISEDCNISCVTFGSPRAFTKTIFDSYKELVPETYRISNTLDPVPRFPFGHFGFKHVGYPIQLENTLLQSNLAKDAMKSLSDSITLDASAASTVVQCVLSIFKMFKTPQELLQYGVLPHQMDRYKSIVESEGGETFLRECLDRFSTEQANVRGPGQLLSSTYINIQGNDEDDDWNDVEGPEKVGHISMLYENEEALAEAAAVAVGAVAAAAAAGPAEVGEDGDYVLVESPKRP